jgi:site-specific DNA-methyltransferase (adenine-specific)
MINEFNVDKIVHYVDNPFKGTQISGGVSYFVIDNKNTKETFELNGVIYDRKVALDFLPYELNTKELKVLNKFLEFKKLDLSNFKAEGYYGISTNDSRLNSDVSGIKCHVSEQKGRIKYLPVNDTSEKIKKDLKKPKIFSTSSYGANPYALGRILKSEGNEICSQSLVSWNFDFLDDMNNFHEYLNTKVFRFAISLLKNKQNVSKTIFSLVPDIEFSKLEKVDDENIYKYLNLTEEDIQTIEERCERLKLLR